MAWTSFAGRCLVFYKDIYISFICIWIRATIPRLRYDKVMKLEWKFLLPVALANVHREPAR